MSSLIRWDPLRNVSEWDPFRELEELSTRLDRLFGRRGGRERERGQMADWAPAVNVSETDQEYIIKVDLPEVTKDQVHVNMNEGMLTIEGERKEEKEEQGRRFHRVESMYGKFSRSFALPADVDVDNLKADFKDGVLQVHIPKRAETSQQSREIPING